MVAAKLDHSRVLVSKFHQNGSTLNGRSAGQRHAQTDRQMQLKIMALQVCNPAKNNENCFIYVRIIVRQCSDIFWDAV